MSESNRRTAIPGEPTPERIGEDQLDQKLAEAKKYTKAIDPKNVLDNIYTAINRYEDEENGPPSNYRPPIRTFLEKALEKWEIAKDINAFQSQIDEAAIGVLIALSNLKLHHLEFETALQYLLAAFKLQAQKPETLQKDLCKAIVTCYDGILKDPYIKRTDEQKKEITTPKDLFQAIENQLPESPERDSM